MPQESDLPQLQGLDEGLADPAGDDSLGSGTSDPDRASDAGSVSGSGLGDSPTGSADPMPDMAGTDPG
jgi:hypothetical protein